MPEGWFQKIKRWLPSSVWGGCILLASSIPGDDLPKQEIPYLDKIVHCGVYGLLGILLARTGSSFRLCLGLAGLFGILDECYQNLTPQRSPDPLDWLADITGAFLGILLVRWLMNRKNNSAT